MPINIPRGQADDVINQMIAVLRTYEVDHPDSRIDLYRQDCVSVRIRIIDPGFAGQSKVERSQNVWRFLKPMDDDVVAEVSSLTLLTPDETAMSFANLEFEDPVPSGL